LGKGQRPAQRVAVPEIVAVAKEDRAAKEKMIEEEMPEPASIAVTDVPVVDAPQEDVLP